IIDSGFVDHPPGEDRLILGHEGLGQIVETGADVRDLKAGDYVVFTVRHGCGECEACNAGCSDFCYTGRYTESGIHKRHGFFREYVTEEEEYLVKVPPELKSAAVLAEPMSIVEKALEQVKIIQTRLPWFCVHREKILDLDYWGQKKTAVVVGAGPIGFLGTCLLRLAGAETHVLERKDPDDIKVRLVEEMGAKYIDIRKSNLEEIVRTVGPVDVILEASGASKFAVELMRLMNRNAVYVLTGIGRGEEEACFDVRTLLRQIVQRNNIVLGTVSSNKNYFEKALADMQAVRKRFGNILERSITDRFSIKDYAEAFAKRPNQIKAIFDFTMGT
ncbi:MAG: alcohol dehydrogenase catalytic domain-containing protein, partial [Nitrososphaerota archaeon]